MPRKVVVIVHGLWMHGIVMRPLERRLRRAGFDTLNFSYASTRRTVKENAARLAERLREINADELHFVGHSLGGLVILRLLESENDWSPGRVVLLGSPVRGSQVAAWLEEKGWGRLIGHARQGALLDPPDLAWDGRRDLGIIAGTKRIGIGQFLRHLPQPNDGTVTVEETRLAGATARLELPISHTALVFSRRVARNTADFLCHGSFTERP